MNYSDDEDDPICYIENCGCGGTIKARQFRLQNDIFKEPEVKPITSNKKVLQKFTDSIIPKAK